MGYQGNYPPSTPLNPTQLGTGVVTTDAIADGAVIPADLSTGGPYWNTSGNVGIGTTSPSVKLQLYNSTADTATYATSGSVTTALIASNTNANGQVGTATNNPLLFLTNASERARIDSSGNVGIGTSSIATNFRQEIVGLAGSNTTPASSGTTQSASAVMRIRPGGGFTGTLDIGQGGGTGSWLQSTDTTNLATTYPLLLNPVGGNVGIGTTSPGFKLEVVSSYNNGLQVKDTTGTVYGGWFTESVGMALVTRSNHQLRFATNDSTRMTISAAGNVGIGFDAQASLRLFVKGSDSTLSNYTIYAQNSSSADLFYVRNDGFFSTGNAGSSPYNATTATAANVVVASNGQLQRSTSSLKYKTDVVDATHGLAEVLQLRPVTYKGKNDGETVFGGLIAEEVDAVGLTEFVQYAEDGSPDALAYGNMVSLLVKAIQELKAELDALKGTK